MPRKLSEIDFQNASTLVCLYFVCSFCNVIDRDKNRSKAGHKCSTCGKAGSGARLAFAVNAHILVDMMQQSFHATSPLGPISGERAHDIATILNFCTLRELLINNFLIENLRAKLIPQEIIDRLLDDNKLAHQKFNPLFSSVVGDKWGNAVLAASDHDGRDYKPISDLMKRAADARNSFLHNGNVWGFDRKFSAECMNNLPQMFGLFVALHNIYTHKLTLSKMDF